MGFKTFQGLLQVAVALSFAEWITKTNVNQEGLVQQPYYRPQDLLGGQVIPNFAPPPQLDTFAVPQHRVFPLKEQGLLEQLLSLDSACNRGDIHSGYQHCSTWPVEAQSNVNAPTNALPDDFGYVSGSESLSPRSSVSPFSGSESPGRLPLQAFESHNTAIAGDYGDSGASWVSPSDDLENINIIDLIASTDYDSLGLTDEFTNSEQKGNASPIQKVLDYSSFRKGSPNAELSPYATDAGKSPSFENVNFYSPTLNNSNGEYDPFSLDFGLSSSSTSDEDLPDDLVEALSTFDKYFKTNPDVFATPKSNSYSPRTNTSSAGKGARFLEMNGLGDVPRQVVPNIKGEFDTHTDIDLPRFHCDFEEGKKQDLASVENPVFDIPDSFVESFLGAGESAEKDSLFSKAGKSKTIVNIGEDINVYKGKGARPKAAKVPGLPFSEEEIIHMPVDKFNSIIESLDTEIASTARDIRRKGKNKIAARNCRKRKLDAIHELDSEIGQVGYEKSALLAEQEQLERELKDIKSKTDFLYDYIFDSLRDENGLPYSREHFSLQYTSDGSVYLVPNSDRRLKSPSTALRRGNQVS